MSDIKQQVKKIDIDVLTSFNTKEGLCQVRQDLKGSYYQLDKNISIIAYQTEVKGQNITTTLKYNNDEGFLSITHIGDAHLRQCFGKEEWYASQHFYCGMSIVNRTFTKLLEVTLTPSDGFIELEYELHSGSTNLGTFKTSWLFNEVER